MDNYQSLSHYLKKTNVLKTTLFIEFSTTMDKGEKKDQVMD
jgi:hypothetical protein